METMWFQVEFYSELEKRWVPLFAREKSETAAKSKATALLPNAESRVVKVTLVTEVCR